MTAPIRLQHLINGVWENGTGIEVASSNPARPGEIVAQGRQAGAADVDRAMSAATAAKRDWARTPAHERGQVLLRAAASLEQSASELGLELAREEGKTHAEGEGEVLRAVQILRYYGHDGDRPAGGIYSSPRRGEKILVTRKPLGVIGVVTPFNFPIAIPAWKIAPALAYGNTVVWKPASTVPLLAMRLAQALDGAGLPPGVVNLLVGPGSMGNNIVEHSALDGLTFTGSTGVGRSLASKAAGRGVPVQAEMGGKNAAIVLADADLELAAEQVMLGAFRSSGQKCTATSRLIVADEIADQFLAELQKRAADLRVGDPTDPKVHMGPVINEAARTSIQKGIDTALSQGAELLAGGHRFTEDPLADGHFIAPTILALPGDGKQDVWTEELFGPVLAVRRAQTTQEALELANDSEFGLSAALFTQDLTQVLAAVDDIDVGILHINSESAGADPHVPFGGVKKSGYGPKEQGEAAREFFSHSTTVYLRGGNSPRFRNGVVDTKHPG